MIIIFKKSDGQVVENTGTNSMFPEGVPNVDDVINNVVTSIGGKAEDYAFIRLHDIKDAEIVNKTFTHEYTIQNSKVVFGNVRPIPQPEPQPPSEMEQLRLEIAEANAEMFEMLITMTGGAM